MEGGEANGMESEESPVTKPSRMAQKNHLIRMTFLLICSVIAVFTTLCFSTSFSFRVKCETFTPDKSEFLIEEIIAYPFHIGSMKPIYVLCEENRETLHLNGDFYSAATFFGTVGVMAIVYIVIALVLYIFFYNIYSNKVWLPVVDSITNAVFILLWLAASIVWTESFSRLKIATDVQTIMNEHEDICKVYVCHSPKEPDYTALYISIVFGYLNFLLWIINIKFIHKKKYFVRITSPSFTR